MSNLWLLTKMQLHNLLFQSNSKKKKQSFATTALTGAVFVGLSLYYSYMLMKGLPSMAYDSVAYLMAYAGTIIIFFYGIQTSQGMLFGFKDYDFLMSLPVRKDDIVFSKVIAYAVMEYLYSALFIIPAMIVYGVLAGQGPVFYVLILLGFTTFPLIPMVLASMVGFLIQWLTAGKRYGTILANTINVVGFVVIYIIFFRIGMDVGAESYTDPTAMFNSIAGFKNVLFVTTMYVKGAIDPHILSLLFSMVLNILVFVLFIYFYSGSILKVNITSTQGFHVDNFELTNKQAKTNSRFFALFKKELMKLFTNFAYFFNTAFPMVLLIIGTVMMFFQGGEIVDIIQEITEYGHDIGIMRYVYEIIIGVIVFFAQMTCTTGSSISLEGKNLWITKTLPISTNEIFLSKILVNVVVILVPSTICLFLMAYTFRFTPLYIFYGFVMILATAIFVSLFGILINLRFPKLEFDRDVVVIKQSMAAFLSVIVPIFLGLGIIILAVMQAVEYQRDIFFWVMGYYILMDIVLIALLETYGRNKFSQLH